MLGKLRSIAPYALLFIAAVYLYRDAGAFASAGRPGQLGPDVWPRAVLVLLMAVCGLEIVRRTFFVAVDAVRRPAVEGNAEPEASAQRFRGCLAGGIALTVAYVLALDWLGFFVSTVLYLALFMLVGRYRRGRVIAATSVVGSLAFVYVFMKIVYVSLPLGRGPFKALSVWILAMLGVH